MLLSSIVHQSDMPTISKFTYLLSLLKGEASCAITGLALTEANYEAARDLLCSRFGRKEQILFGHNQGLLNQTFPGNTVSDL